MNCRLYIYLLIFALCSVDIYLLFSGIFMPETQSPRACQVSRLNISDLLNRDEYPIYSSLNSVDIYLLFSGIFMPEKQSLRVCQETSLNISDRLNRDEYPCLQQINIYATSAICATRTV